MSKYCILLCVYGRVCGGVWGGGGWVCLCGVGVGCVCVGVVGGGDVCVGCVCVRPFVNQVDCSENILFKQ